MVSYLFRSFILLRLLLALDGHSVWMSNLCLVRDLISPVLSCPIWPGVAFE